MADFYPLLARAVAQLANDSDQARQELYDHARTILVSQLRGRDRRVSAVEIMREQAALEAAIRRLEMESPTAETAPQNGPTSRHPIGNPVEIADSTQTKISKRNLEEVFPKKQPSGPHGIGPGTFAIRATTEQRAAAAASDLDMLPAGRSTKILLTVADKIAWTTQDLAEALPLSQGAAQPRSAQLGMLPPSSRPSHIILIVAITAIIAVIAMAGISLAAVYIPRWLWLFEHLG